ncbi:MAG: serine/threonine protein kinase, partial [Leifsonia sp.]
MGMSVPWSPPEMFGDVPNPDVRSDIFSLAATIHTVLAGRTPFEVPGGPNGTLDLIARIERGEVTPLQRDDVPATLSAVLARGMAPRRENRYPTVIEFARALQRVELELGYAPTTIELPIAEEEPRERPGGDETRMRAVPEVAAQAPVAEPSVARAPDRVPAPESVPSATVPVAPLSRRRMLVGGLVGVLAVLTILAIALAVTLGGSLVRQPTTPTPGATGGSAIVGPSVPQPTNGVAQPSADGTSVEFSWTNPHRKTGDIYYWARAETPSDRQATSTPSVTVTGIVPGSRVCM